VKTGEAESSDRRGKGAGNVGDREYREPRGGCRRRAAGDGARAANPSERRAKPHGGRAPSPKITGPRSAESPRPTLVPQKKAHRQRHE